MTQAVELAQAAASAGPFDSLRDFALALEARGQLLRIAEMDQDRFEATGFAYRLIEEYGWHDAPAFLIERIKVDGRWLDGPLLGNIYGSWLSEALAYGAPAEAASQRELYRATFEHLKGQVDAQGNWPKLAPTEIDAAAAPCKAVELRGEQIDILKFPWIQTNPADGGRYITAGTVFIEDPEMGRNVGTYRCQVKGPRRIGVNTEIGQHAWSFLMRAKKRGAGSVPAAVVMGADPITFALGTSKLSALGEDELEIAGGLRGRPVELVKCNSSEILVPAHAEIVLEGEIQLADLEEEGPYGEVYGYMGLKKPSNFFMDIQAVTHRPQPWVSNSFAGITKLTMSIPQIVTNNLNYARVIRNLVEFYRPVETTGVAVLSINKRLPGEGMAAGQHVAAADLFAKIIIVVDGDIDVQNKTQIFHALGTRWQPNPGALIIPQTRGMPLDPSAPTRWLTSKIVIDATRQLPSEGGPEKWPEVSRVLLEQQSPDTFALVASRWAEYWQDWPGKT
jgi:4-hydroxy-3-polyprenylbenzoate decarboxylase